ncbi:hypothetical protein AVEN_101685-1 [Araneus ventricosus]|uniref:Uncharacterized protein n=1 Tax=Araneus ventricosus TaxID=182803 RepID=A0A4Y2HM97_ARAVE|nr:hypothetical protein AVEN_101685-1 [Araneus ventricosus]
MRVFSLIMVVDFGIRVSRSHSTICTRSVYVKSVSSILPLRREAIKALFASESEADDDNFDEEKALKQILRSQKDGSFGNVPNIYYVLPVLQCRSLALFASESEADEDNFDEEKALKQILRSQKDGSFGNVPNIYYVLPVLQCRSLVNISSSHCKAPVIDGNSMSICLFSAASL